MATPDLNLLLTLEVLLQEGSVARAAKRLRLSPSAMSRQLARLRDAVGDPLLVKAGRGLVPTPRALELRALIGPSVDAARAILRPAEAVELGTLQRRFTLRSSDGFVDNFGAALVERVARDAPGVLLRFVRRHDRDSVLLRDGSADLETGVVGATASPEVRTQALYRDRFVGVVRAGHALGGGRITSPRYLKARHILVSRSGTDAGPVDSALAERGLERRIAAIVDGFAAAIALARGSDLVATVPARHTGNLRDGVHSFALPFPAPQITVSMLWHPRMDADSAQRWLRQCVREVCAPP